MTKYKEASVDTCTVRVREVAESIQYGHTASAMASEEGPRFLRITDIQDGRVDWDNVPSCNIADGDIPKYRLAEGDLVFARTGATTGKSFLIRKCPDAVFASYLIRVRASKDVDPRYLAYFFQSPDYWRQIEEGKRGIGQPNVNGKTLGEVKLPLCPFDEQQRIVAEIEKQFTRLDAGVASLKRVQAALKRYRASVLKAACEGRLVPTEAELARKENRSYETGEQILQRILKERREKWTGKGKYKEPASANIVDLPQLPEGWCWARLGQLGFTFGGLTKNPRRSKLKKQLPYLRVANVYANELRLDDVATIGVDDSELNKLLLRAGDLLVVEGNGSKDQIGRLAIWDGSIDPCVHQNHVIKVRPTIRALGKWILNWLLSPSGRHFVELVASSTSGLYTLSVNKVGDLPIALAPVAEQERIVAEIERRLSVIEELQTVASTEFQRAIRLRQSILQRSFAADS